MSKEKKHDKKHKEDKPETYREHMAEWDSKKDKEAGEEKPKAKAEKKAALKEGAVRMVFKEHKYYNDMDTPMFEAGKVYMLEGADWIARWLKRGGEIVEGELELPDHDVNPSQIVANAPEKAETGDKESSKE